MSLHLLVLILPGTILFSGPFSQDASQKTPQAKQYFIALFSRGPQWDQGKPANEQPGFKEHSENLRRLRAEKKIAIGARYGEVGMIIVEAGNEPDARSFFAPDSMVHKKTFTLELHPFRPFYKGSIE